MKRIDIGGTSKHHQWAESTLFPSVEVTELAPFPNIPYRTYSQAVYIPMQASTYLETAAHMYPERIKITDLALERLFTEAVVLKTPLGPKGAITSSLLRQALQGTGVFIQKGDSLLVGTGWDKMWDKPNYFADSPHFTTEAINWIIDQEVGLLGSDACRWDDGQQGFFPSFFKSDTLLLAPLVNLMEVSQPRVRLITLPMKLAGVCAAPCRVIVEES